LADSEAVRLGPLVPASGHGELRQQTFVRLSWDHEALLVSFEVEDDDPWATLLDPDGALWEEEVVEVFLAPGATTPTRYVEIEVNPLGTWFSGWVTCPHGDRRELHLDRCIPWVGARVSVERREAGWGADLLLPWTGLGIVDVPACWRVNFTRIDRPRNGAAPELGCWSPTLTEPADFHRPARFGMMVLEGPRPSADLEPLVGADLGIPLVRVPLRRK
jgi:hypothetical protein